jgi:hypothetical protein
MPPSVQSHSPLCIATQSLADIAFLVRRQLPLTQWFSLEIHVIGTERKAKVKPSCSIFKPWVEPKVNPRSSCAFCAVFL